MLGDSLILMGEIGGNDYNYPFFEGKIINEIKELVPLIIKAISSAIVVTNLNIALPSKMCVSNFNKLIK